MTVDKDKTFHTHHYSQDTSKRFIVSAGRHPGPQWVLWKQWGFLSNVDMQCLEGHLYRHCQRNFWSKQELGPAEPLVLLRRREILGCFAVCRFAGSAVRNRKWDWNHPVAAIRVFKKIPTDLALFYLNSAILYKRLYTFLLRIWKISTINLVNMLSRCLILKYHGNSVKAIVN